MLPRGLTQLRCQLLVASGTGLRVLILLSLQGTDAAERCRRQMPNNADALPEANFRRSASDSNTARKASISSRVGCWNG